MEARATLSGPPETATTPVVPTRPWARMNSAPLARGFTMAHSGSAQLVQLQADVGRTHQRLADEHGLDVGGLQSPDVVAGADTAFTDHTGVRGHAGHQVERVL